MCNKKGCTINNYPLKIVATAQQVTKFDYDEDLVKKFIRKADLTALTQACKDVCYHIIIFHTFS
jgi:hypothetical protein